MEGCCKYEFLSRAPRRGHPGEEAENTVSQFSAPTPRCLLCTGELHPLPEAGILSWVSSLISADQSSLLLSAYLPSL